MPILDRIMHILWSMPDRKLLIDLFTGLMTALAILQISQKLVLSFQNSDLIGIRKWRVRNFENFLIFYLPDSEGVTIVRIMHAAQDWWVLLDVETN